MTSPKVKTNIKPAFEAETSTSDFWNIGCKCGHEDSIDRFTSTPINGELPLGEYQCPKCKSHWEVMPGKINLLPEVL